jgi:hypothetical protein
VSPVEELAALGAFYRVPVQALITRHGAALARYAEWVLARHTFAPVTLGEVDELAPLGSTVAQARFRSAAARWPEAVAGIKLEAEPTLYVRSVCPWDEGVAWLRDMGLDVSALPRARTLYGLGFQGDVIKTYSLCDDGFVSWRLDASGLLREHKEYRADVDWRDIAWPDARWAEIGELGRRLGFRAAGHVGKSSDGEMKVYVERAGAIATDRTLA